jgi:hypothetical protein
MREPRIGDEVTLNGTVILGTVIGVGPKKIVVLLHQNFIGQFPQFIMLYDRALVKIFGDDGPEPSGGDPPCQPT